MIAESADEGVGPELAAPVRVHHGGCGVSQGDGVAQGADGKVGGHPRIH
ncbi:MAG: hypothetical protein K0S98_965 [Propionibacteriaceae bacterium]|nr:hypothetical protein [Propionibacteriaceae bacterium]